MAQIVTVVGCDHRQSGTAGKLRDAAADLVLDLETVVLHLEEVIAVAEDVPVHLGRLDRRVLVAREQIHGDLPLGTRRQRGNTRRVLAQDLVIDARLVVEALEERERGQPDQVLETLLVARQQHEVVGRITRAVLAAAARDVGLHADDRLDAGLLGLLVELDRAEHRAVISQRHRRHAEFDRLLDHARNRARAVQQRIVAVIMEMDEVGGLHGASCAKRVKLRTRKTNRWDAPLATQFSTNTPLVLRAFPARSVATTATV